VNNRDKIVMIFIGNHLDVILTLVRSEVWMILLPSPELLLGPKLLEMFLCWRTAVAAAWVADFYSLPSHSRWQLRQEVHNNPQLPQSLV